VALRSGIDLRTLQQRMGHSDIKVTMEYLHYIEPEEHPMDKLPY
jgi:site-specific recombinase XerD